MENKKDRMVSFGGVLFFVLFCGSVFFNYKLASFLDEYDEQVERQDSMIRRLTFSNDLVKEYFDISEDTINHTTTYSLKEEKRNKEIEPVTKYVDPVFVKGGKRMTSDELVASINASDNESVEAIRKLADMYNTLVHDYNELGKKCMAIKDTVVIQGMALNLIKRNYGIDFVSNLNGDVRTVKVFGEKVDSALLLLPYYRHKLSYDTKTKAWIVEYERSVKK